MAKNLGQQMSQNMNCKTVFITATDTDAGKTYVSVMLLQGLKQLNQQVIAVKPIAAGGLEVSGHMASENSDALLLQQHSSNALPYSWHNPLFFQQPVAPHLAAALSQQPINEAVLNHSLQQWQQHPADICVIEGAGGWLLPLNNKRYLADWVVEHKLAVIVVIGVKLGCLNHAMLTLREIERSGCKIVGWVANCVDPHMLLLEQNIQDLQQRISQPCLAVLPFQPCTQLSTKDSDPTHPTYNSAYAEQAKQLATAVMALL